MIKKKAKGREFANILRSLEQFIQTVKGQNNFWYQNDFLTCSWRFIRSNILEQSEFKLKFLGGSRNMSTARDFTLFHCFYASLLICYCAQIKVQETL